MYAPNQQNPLPARLLIRRQYLNAGSNNEHNILFSNFINL